ncbi:GNAT family N-acetyltransferase [Pantoea agglomerans]|uniref:GNAT family N-acetyltransferase n=1 Tax=Enterobacter agglomerans TaxID=549 RepID=UPI000C06B1FD|nr:GNAT family N-acetyltransferase [Pantoea agglomerans]PHP92511.1 GNAT family N-acetyltransferase [Pantoea agglomerans]
MKTPALETSRLYLRPLQAEDALQIQKIFPQWEIVRHLAAGFPWPFPDDGASRYVNMLALPASAKGLAWFWTIRRKEEPSAMIGLISLSDEKDNNRGFWIVPEWQRKGYMSEACYVVTDFWFNTLHREVLRAPKASANSASKKISLNNGMRLVQNYKKQYIEGELDSELWEITRQEWNSQKI